MTCYEDDENIQTSSIRIGDDTNAFDRKWLKVNAPKGIDSKLITKCVFQCGPLLHTEVNPEFPYYIDFKSEDTLKLSRENYCYMEIYDSKGRHCTLEGTLRIIGKKQVVFSTLEDKTIKECQCKKTERIRY